MKSNIWLQWHKTLCVVDQTNAVNKLLQNLIIDAEEIEWWYLEEDKNGEEALPEIKRWLLFPAFRDFDFQKLLVASIPVLQSELGTWVGLPNQRSLADIYDYLSHFPESAIYPNSEKHQTVD